MRFGWLRGVCVIVLSNPSTAGCITMYSNLQENTRAFTPQILRQGADLAHCVHLALNCRSVAQLLLHCHSGMTEPVALEQLHDHKKGLALQSVELQAFMQGDKNPRLFSSSRRWNWQGTDYRILLALAQLRKRPPAASV